MNFFKKMQHRSRAAHVAGFAICFLLTVFVLSSVKSDAVRADETPAAIAATTTESPSACCSSSEDKKNSSTRLQVLVGSLTVFTLAVLVGFEIIAKVPPTLHTPLMSGSNAISGITVVGALLAAGHQMGGFASLLGVFAIVFAGINVVGGFLVTHRMLLMFKKK